MTDNVVDFRRPEDGYRGLLCRCGSAWFQPRGVTFSVDLTITGFAYPAVCIECGDKIEATP